MIELPPSLRTSLRIGRNSWMAALACALTACASGNAYQVRMVGPPAFLAEGRTERFSDPTLTEHPDDPRLLYATLRARAEDGSSHTYSTARAEGVSVGVARVKIAKDNVSWTQLEDMQFVKNNGSRIPLEVAD